MGWDPKIGKYGIVAINSVVAVFGITTLGVAIAFWFDEDFREFATSSTKFLNKLGPGYISKLAEAAKQDIFLEMIMPFTTCIFLIGLIGCCAGMHENRVLLVLHIAITAAIAITALVFTIQFRTDPNFMYKFWLSLLAGIRQKFVDHGLRGAGTAACEFFQGLDEGILSCCGVYEDDISAGGPWGTGGFKSDERYLDWDDGPESAKCHLQCRDGHNKKLPAGYMTCPQMFNREIFTKKTTIIALMLSLFFIELVNVGFAVSALRSACARRRRRPARAKSLPDAEKGAKSSPDAENGGKKAKMVMKMKDVKKIRKYF